MIADPVRSRCRRAAACAVLALAALTSGCQRSTPATPPEIDPALTQYVLSELPTDLPNRVYLDYGGKVALVGYAIEPKGVVAPGTHVKLTLYWQSLGQLGPGWGLFTHLVIPGQPHRLLDSAGPLRKAAPGSTGAEHQAFGPSAWEPGKIYVDPLEFDMPQNLRVPEVTIMAGVWHEAVRPLGDKKLEDPKLAISGLRLPVVSGPVDDAQRGVVLHISTGLPAVMPSPPAPPPRLAGAAAAAAGSAHARAQNEANGAH